MKRIWLPNKTGIITTLELEATLAPEGEDQKNQARSGWGRLGDCKGNEQLRRACPQRQAYAVQVRKWRRQH
jgi:hypothetical protein